MEQSILLFVPGTIGFSGHFYQTLFALYNCIYLANIHTLVLVFCRAIIHNHALLIAKDASAQNNPSSCGPEVRATFVF